MSKVIVMGVSGGLDSAVLLAHAKFLQENSKLEILPVSFRYPSKHNAREIPAFRKLMNFYGFQFKYVEVDLTEAFQQIKIYSKSVLFNSTINPIPKGHYNDPVMRQTIVPGRNLIFASVLAGIAQAQAEHQKIPEAEVWLGAHLGDWEIYPDCRTEWFYKLHDVVDFQSEGGVKLQAPFMNSDKSEVVKRGIELGVPFELTRTCYQPLRLACGECGACRERLEAFEKNGVKDPLKYAGQVDGR